MTTIKPLLEKYEQFIKNESYYIYNKDLDYFKNDADSIKYIIIGDNPGQEEAKQNRYFIGQSGKMLRTFFDTELNIKDFEKEVIVFNKTPFSTKSTQDLKNVDPDILVKSMQKTADIILKIQSIINKPILIFGKSNLKTKIFRPFTQALLKNSTADIYIYSHPAYGQLIKEWTAGKLTYPNLDNQDLLLTIGKNNTEKYL